MFFLLFSAQLELIDAVIKNIYSGNTDETINDYTFANTGNGFLQILSNEFPKATAYLSNCTISNISQSTREKISKFLCYNEHGNAIFEDVTFDDVEIGQGRFFDILNGASLTIDNVDIKNIQSVNSTQLINHHYQSMDYIYKIPFLVELS